MIVARKRSKRFLVTFSASVGNAAVEMVAPKMLQGKSKSWNACAYCVIKPLRNVGGKNSTQQRDQRPVNERGKGENGCIDDARYHLAANLNDSWKTPIEGE